ncbi:MAG: hypothetical protein QGI83_23045, partial [Candidatus Latescibacteria bacterium]|nr:hypothetical protein [Candidatus Latescibacterota bacterium]
HAFIADNQACGIHRAGYNGVASLVPKSTGNNIFVPTYAGLNYETISLPGLASYKEKTGYRFEPRAEAMHIESASENRVVLVQPETSHAHVSARIAFTAEEPHYLHQQIELTFHRRFCSEDEPNAFRSLWASYLHQPPDRHLYLKPDWSSGSDATGWFGITREDHGSPETLAHPMPDDRELDVAGHLEAAPPGPSRSAEVFAGLSEALKGPLGFYYGLSHHQAFLMMFAQPDRVRLAYSPCGGGKQPAWNPAWDYLLHLDDAELDRPYTWDLCLVVRPFGGRTDILDEVRRYLG